MQGPPHAPSENYRRWKRRQRRLLILLGVLVLLEIALLARGLMLLPAFSATAAAPTPTPTFTPTPTPSPVPTAPPPTIQAAASMLEDVSTHMVLSGQNVDKELPMASTTKIMTAVVTLETGHLDDLVTIGSDVLNLPSDASKMGLVPGDVLTMRQLLYGLMLPSGDDAAIAIADAVGKERGANFIDLMNQQAQLLGLEHTHYVNSNGLDAPGHYTSASDLVNLTRFALRLPFFSTVINTYKYIIPASSQHHNYPPLINTNELLAPNTGYPGANGVKTGTTGLAGDCLVFSAIRSGQQLVGVVLGAPTDAARFADARALLDWGFSVIGGAS